MNYILQASINLYIQRNQKKKATLIFAPCQSEFKKRHLGTGEIIFLKKKKKRTVKLHPRVFAFVFCFLLSMAESRNEEYFFFLSFSVFNIKDGALDVQSYYWHLPAEQQNWRPGKEVLLLGISHLMEHREVDPDQSFRLPNGRNQA